LVNEFIAANPKLTRDMIVVECGGPGNRLKEVRICFNKGGGFRACGRNEDQRRLCSAERMYVPPVRISAERAPPQRARARSRQQPQSKSGGEMLPGPR
jgi:ribonuclease T2